MKGELNMGEKTYVFSKSINDVIKERSSVRNYKSIELSQEIQEEIINYSASISGPFDPKVRFKIINVSDIDPKRDGKIGTYGFIKGAPSYIAGIVENGERDLEQLGYIFEYLILYLTSINIGTCWLGGTFTKDSFVKQIDLQEHEILSAVSPIGHIEKKRRLADTAIRFMAGSDKRKPWDELFFNGRPDSPLSKDQAEDYHLPLEMVRLAPSASNKQPWRVIKNNNSYEFYLKSDKGYSTALGFNIQRIDMGIAMCHFELTTRELGLKGNWNFAPPSSVYNGLEFIASWITN